MFKIWKMLNLIVWMTSKLKNIMMIMTEELQELFHTATNTDHRTDNLADTTSIIMRVTKRPVLTIMVCVHSRRDAVDHLDLRDPMEMMAHLVLMDRQDHVDLKDHQETKEQEDQKDHKENQATQGKMSIIIALEMVVREKEDQMVDQAIQDHPDHQDLLDLKVMLACLHLGIRVNLVILVHLDEMEKMDALDMQEGQDRKEKWVREISLRNSTLVTIWC